jgi:DNA-binding MarR family transcriptional regulator
MVVEDMLDYQLYLVYRDCGYVTERMCKMRFGVTRRRWRILATLSEAEGISVGGLAKRADLDIAQTSRTIGALAREGYVKRLANRANARLAHVVLTDKGRDLCASMFAGYRKVNQQLLRALDESQVRQLTTIITILRNTAGQLLTGDSPNISNA